MSEDTRAGRRHLIVLLLVIAGGLAVLDQVTKYAAEAYLSQGERVPVLGDVLGLQLIYNPGAAFSLATGMTWVFTVVAVAVVVVILRVARRLRSRVWAVTLGALLGGSLGNLYDRLFRDPGFGRGHVVDFINYNQWFVGNVADIAIVVAAVLICFLALRGIEIDGSHQEIARTDEPEPETPQADPEAPVQDADEDVYSGRIEEPAEDGPDLDSWFGRPGTSAASPEPARRPRRLSDSPYDD